MFILTYKVTTERIWMKSEITPVFDTFITAIMQKKLYEPSC